MSECNVRLAKALRAAADVREASYQDTAGGTRWATYTMTYSEAAQVVVGNDPIGQVVTSMLACAWNEAEAFCNVVLGPEAASNTY